MSRRLLALRRAEGLREEENVQLDNEVEWLTDVLPQGMAVFRDEVMLLEEEVSGLRWAAELVDNPPLPSEPFLAQLTPSSAGRRRDA